ncbi:MAG: oligopeptidase B, partial [Bacteroidota bacterium]
MKQHFAKFVGLLLATTLLTISSCEKQSSTETENTIGMYQKKDIKPPVAQKVGKELTIHEDTRTDNYYWMRDREDQAVIDHLMAENSYTKEMTAHLETLQEELFEEIKGRIKEEDQSVPYKDNGYYYITRYEKGKEYPIYSRKKESLDAEEEILLNVNELAKDHDYFNVSGRTISMDNKLMAYGEDTLSRRIYTLRFKNLETGEMLEDVIGNTTGGAVWANDNKTVFYVTKEPGTLRSYKVFRHVLGTPVDQDVEVWHEEDNTFLCYAYKSKSDKYIIIGSYQTLSQEFRVLEADNPVGEFRVIQARERNLEYRIYHRSERSHTLG